MISSHLRSLVIGMAVLTFAAAVSLYRDGHAKSLDATARHDVLAAQTAMETFYVDGHRSYAADAQDLTHVDHRLAGARMLTATGTGETYTVSVTSRSTPATVFTVTRAPDGSIVRRCDKPGVEGCPAAGIW
jgi:Tfp pilus assembly protein PilE